ncbi:hypothetical protein MSMTP_2397 [Methanosarcina sp. MTP4]|uniref:hypothetical protein n=1 Tax=Methanosarcina sp. MTP4 TaxID=1434100 RepID=UPI0006158EBA|nr:hypothetical protein [Methanosarcina sp. MTP4]AKB25866.1 hypothetical protein MSMTP_2397 [Methanosarcina sp. MTP4]
MTFEADLPFEWEPDNASFDINAHKKLSILRYETKYSFDSDKMSQHFKKNLLKSGREFGCIDVKKNQKSIHLLFAKMGDRRHSSAAFDPQTKEYLSRNSFKIKNLIVSTLHVDNFPDENNYLNLLVFNGGSIKNERLFSQYKYFLTSSQPKQLGFNEWELRKLCFDKFENNLFEISFNPVKELGFGTTQQADYKSETHNILDPNAVRIKELKETNNIIITGFKSSIVSGHDDLGKEYEIKFEINGKGKIELEFPKLSWIDLDSDDEIEIKFYEYARKIYDEIVSKELYCLPTKHKIAHNQTSLDILSGVPID